ncbi:hypothetical protein TNCV_1328911 [Trichonephila clavipes]|nr:hypothetical protein TNCV_1328911 [Trichonephila clavipes]
MDEEANFPIAASVLRNNLYMDDVPCGAATLERRIVENLKGINRVAGPLTTKEFEKAGNLSGKKVQEQEFSSDINHLKSKGVCHQTVS